MSTPDTATARRDSLAIVGGFGRLAPDRPHGANRVGIDLPHALMKAGRFRTIHAYHDYVSRPATVAALAMPRVADVDLEVRELLGLAHARSQYQAIYVAEGASAMRMPAFVRPRDDFAPLVLQFGTTHNEEQWAMFLVAAMTGVIRETDVVVAKAERSAAALRATWGEWRERFGVAVPRVECIPNGVVLEENKRDESLGRALRETLALRADDPVFLCFSRLSPHTKGDQRGLVALWREVVLQQPRATLLLAGASTERAFVDELQTTARVFGVAHRVHVLANPFDVWPRARTALMSAADAFVHLSTGAEEALSLVVLEAMAHELPVVASDWSGVAAAVSDGVDGLVVPTTCGPLPDEVASALWGLESSVHRGLMAQSVAIDSSVAISAFVRLCDRDLARRMGARAGERIRAGHRIEEIAARHVALIDDASDRAAHAWRGPTSRSPLVSSDAVVRALATARLTPDDTVLLVDETAAELAPDLRSDVPQATVSVLRDGRSLSARVLCERVAAHLGAAAPFDALWPRYARVILRLANYHVVEIVRAGAA